MKKVCVITGTRADYGLLRWVIEGICQSHLLDLQLIVTGTHLSPEFGMTIREIETDRYKIDRKVEMLLSSDTSVGVAKSMGLGVIGFSDAFAELKPDLVVILGDRYEIFAAAAAAMIACIPIAHLHGGEATEGAFDEAIRHSISKMSHLHFVATEEYRQRVIQLGEQPKYVFNVGGLGIDGILNLELLSRNDLEIKLGFKFFKRNLLITFHPVTLERNKCSDQIDELLIALAELEDTGLIFTMPNADTDARLLHLKINTFCEEHSNARFYSSLGQLVYLSCLKHFDGVVGNSSSGLLEAPSFKKGTINIGDRQLGRLRASSVIDCLPERESISKALEHLFSTKFQDQLLDVKNPYGTGGASDNIIKVLEQQQFDTLLKKRFYDLPISTKS
jgi:GDP/UDP-N,N'-diacetylbacillosamine 2-epimerase (hydrolysing)